MKGFCYTTVLFATIFIVTNVQTESTSNPCKYVKDAFINDPSSCPAYFKCENQQTISGNCDSPFWFDKRSGKCDYPQNVECEDEIITNPCDNKDDGFIDDPSACSAYFYCNGGVAEPGNCPDGLHFDEDKCIYPEGCVDDDDSSTEKDICKNIPNDVILGHPTSCSIFYVCFSNKEIKTECVDSHFDLKTGSCIEKKESKCDDSSSGGGTVPGDKICEDDSDDEKFVNDPKSCAGFYQCIEKKPANFGTCPKNQWFAKADQACKWSLDVSETECPNRCEGKKSGYVLKIGTDCKKYYACKAGAIQGKDASECPGDYVFDGAMEMCVVKTPGFTCAKP